MCKCHFLNVYNFKLIKFIRITCFSNFQTFFSFANVVKLSTGNESFLVQKLERIPFANRLSTISFAYITFADSSFAHINYCL